MWLVCGGKCKYYTLRPTQNGRNFAEDNLKFISVFENGSILIQISLIFTQLTTRQIGRENGLALNMRQIIIWNIDGLVFWRICALDGPDATLVLRRYFLRLMIKFELCYLVSEGHVEIR